MNKYSKKHHAIYAVCMFGLLSFSSALHSMVRMYVGLRPLQLQRFQVPREQRSQKEVMGGKKATDSASVGLLQAKKSTRTHSAEHTRSASLGEEWLGKSADEISAGNAFAAADAARYHESKV